jgi:ribose-phosphate pyrophosphokinase
MNRFGFWTAVIMHVNMLWFVTAFISNRFHPVCRKKLFHPSSLIIKSKPGPTIADEWKQFYEQKRRQRKFQVISAPQMEKFAQQLASHDPLRFRYHKTNWGKFPDGTDNIEIGGFYPVNEISGEDVLLLASFHNNDVTLSQFSVMITLLQSFVRSLTVVLPFYPVGTMERIVREGQVPTANTYAQLFSNLPSCGQPTRLIIYDLHTLQNRFYLHGNAIASLQSTITVLLDHISKLPLSEKIDCIAFPDDGAAKRFRNYFSSSDFEIVTCGKTRTVDNDGRTVVLQDGNPAGRHVLIVDDLVQSGGTLFECGTALRQAGAKEVSAFVAHAVFPQDSWQRFLRQGGDRNCFRKFYVTNSIPTLTQKLPVDDVFTVLDISQRIIHDLDQYS